MQEAPFPRIEIVEGLMVNAMKNVFSTMLSRNLEFKARYSREKAGIKPFYSLGTKDPLVVGSIGFVGEANGVVYIYMHQDVAFQIASAMTGMDVAELKGEFEIVKDVVGEVSNMTIGTFKNGLCDLGFNCRVTLPTVLRGSQMEVDSIQSASRETFHFDFQGQPVVMDLFIQENSN
ncbi:MAG TPA: chemotaxis protein CheX [Opitutales bacterium]|nr:chemotaxis protein CheX [Opitutales bacterium]